MLKKALMSEISFDKKICYVGHVFGNHLVLNETKYIIFDCMRLKPQKSQSHDFDLTFRLFSFLKSFFCYFASKMGPNSPKVCQGCKVLIK